tara:strand:+ start:223 stop:1215 length:993 start_codon:yes stop_codon:yes gene_type:complete
VDIMGGDFGPNTVIKAVSEASKLHPNVNFRLFGDKTRALNEIAKDNSLKNFEIIHTSEYIKSDDEPVNALRKLKRSSLRLAVNDVEEKKSHGLVSAGNTGALMAISKFVLKTIGGISRPAIAGIMPTLKGEIVILDLGANLDCTDDNLVQFALMGEVFSKSLLGIKTPSIGILNVGSEEIKGNAVVKQTFEELEKLSSYINFHGFIEGNDINKGIVDVVVTDGFSGNIALKTAEGVAELIVSFLQVYFKSSLLAKLGYILSKPALNRFKARIDPRKYNGAVLLGLNGIVVKSHGRADSFGFSNAISAAISLIENNYNSEIKKKLDFLSTI